MPWDYDAETGSPLYSDDSPVPSVAFEKPEIAFSEDDSAQGALEYQASLGDGGVEFSPEGSAANQVEFNPEAAPPPPGMASQGSSYGYSESQSKSGINFNTLDELDARAAKDADKIAAPPKSDAEAMERGYTDAANAAKTATANLGEFEARKIEAESEYAGKLATLQQQHAIESATEYEKAKQETAKYAADYDMQLKQLATMSTNPGRLFSNMTKPEKAGTLISAFVADFLGAKGIKTSAMSTLNAFIDRDIAAQVQDINTQKDVVSGFKTMWDMQRQQSASDYEASMRTKGMFLEAFKTEVAGRLGQFDSDIARARIPMAIAGIDKELAGQKAEIIKFKAEQHNQAANRWVTTRGQNLSAAVQREQMAHSEKISNAKAESEARAAAAKAHEEERKVVVRVAEPEMRAGPGGIKIPTGNIIGRVAGIAATPEQADKLTTKISAAQKANAAVERLATIQRSEGGVYNWGGKTMTADEVESELFSVYHDLSGDVIRAKTGTAASKEEMAKHEQIIPFNDFKRGILTAGNSGEIAAYVADKWKLREIDALNKEAVIRLTPPSEKQMKDHQGGISSELFAGDRASSETRGRGAEVTDITKTIGTINSSDTREGKPTKVEKDSDVYNDAAAFFTSRGKVVEVNGKTTLGDNYLDKYKDGDKVRNHLVKPLEESLPKWYPAIHSLGEKAISLDTTKAEYDEIVGYLVEQAGKADDYKNPGVRFDTREKEDIANAALVILNEVTATGFRGN